MGDDGEGVTGIGKSGSEVSIGISACNEVSYAVDTRMKLRNMTAKSRSKRCTFDGAVAV